MWEAALADGRDGQMLRWVELNVHLPQGLYPLAVSIAPASIH